MNITKRIGTGIGIGISNIRLGIELVGEDFSGGLDNWFNTDGAWSIISGEAFYSGDTFQPLVFQTPIFKDNTAYKIVVGVTIVSGALLIRGSFTNRGYSPSETIEVVTETKQVDLVYNGQSATPYLTFMFNVSYGAAEFYIDNVSIREVL